MANRKQLQCVHLQCKKPQHAKKLCRSHYEALHYHKWKAARNLRERQLRREELVDFDVDDYWAWVKQELQLL